MSIIYHYESFGVPIVDYVGRVFMIRQCLREHRHNKHAHACHSALVWHPRGSRPKFAWISIHVSSWSYYEFEAKVDADLTGKGRVAPHILVLWDDYLQKNPLIESKIFQYVQELKG